MCIRDSLLAAVGGDGLLEIDANPNPLREEVFSPVINNGTIDLGTEPGLGLDISEILFLRQNPAYCNPAVTVAMR